MTDINRYSPRRAGRYPLFTATENGCTHKAYNTEGSNVRQFKLDGEVFPPNREPQRCDYLLLNDSKQTAYFIELKGAQVSKAIEQIETTICEIKASIPQYLIYRRIVLKKGTHGVQDSCLLQWKRQHIKSVKTGTVVLEEAI